MGIEEQLYNIINPTVMLLAWLALLSYLIFLIATTQAWGLAILAGGMVTEIGFYTLKVSSFFDYDPHVAIVYGRGADLVLIICLVITFRKMHIRVRETVFELNK